MKIKTPKSTKAYGFVGVWDDNSIGWSMPQYLHKHDTRHNPSSYRKDTSPCFLNYDRLYLCEVTIKPILDKLGRPITRLAKKKIGIT